MAVNILILAVRLREYIADIEGDITRANRQTRNLVQDSPQEALETLSEAQAAFMRIQEHGDRAVKALDDVLKQLEACEGGAA
jgi:ABC-type transporter Mla subunit MlaD